MICINLPIEIKSKVRSSYMTALVYHGPSREKVSARQLAKYDMVITTYGTVQTEISKVIPEPEGKKSTRLDDLKPINLDDVDTKKAALLNIVWERIILDEAHQIRNPVGKYLLIKLAVRAGMTNLIEVQIRKFIIASWLNRQILTDA